LEQVKKEISQESEVKHPQKLPPDWRSWVVSDSRGNFGINLRAMFLYCLRESRLIFWLAGEFILLVITGQPEKEGLSGEFLPCWAGLFFPLPFSSFSSALLWKNFWL